MGLSTTQLDAFCVQIYVGCIGLWLSNSRCTHHSNVERSDCTGIRTKVEYGDDWRNGEQGCDRFFLRGGPLASCGVGLTSSTVSPRYMSLFLPNQAKVSRSTNARFGHHGNRNLIDWHVYALFKHWVSCTLSNRVLPIAVFPRIEGVFSLDVTST